MHNWVKGATWSFCDYTETCVLFSLKTLADSVFNYHSPHAAHAHPPPAPGQSGPQGLPGALPSDYPGPTTPLAVSQINEHYIQQRQSVSDRLEADRGYDSVFSQ